MNKYSGLSEVYSSQSLMGPPRIAPQLPTAVFHPFTLPLRCALLPYFTSHFLTTLPRITSQINHLPQNPCLSMCFLREPKLRQLLFEFLLYGHVTFSLTSKQTKNPTTFTWIKSLKVTLFSGTSSGCITPAAHTEPETEALSSPLASTLGHQHIPTAGHTFSKAWKAGIPCALPCRSVAWLASLFPSTPPLTAIFDLTLL